jgi:hypothetical protein
MGIMISFAHHQEADGRRKKQMEADGSRWKQMVFVP